MKRKFNFKIIMMVMCMTTRMIVVRMCHDVGDDHGGHGFRDDHGAGDVRAFMISQVKPPTFLFLLLHYNIPVRV